MAHPTLRNGSYHARLDDRRIHFEVHGDGPPLMIVPNSWGIDSTGLRGLLRVLERAFTTIYFDPRGMGSSDPIAVADDMGRAAVRNDFDALRRHLGLPRVHALGWSSAATNLIVLASERAATISAAVLLHGIASFTAADVDDYDARHPQDYAAYIRYKETLARAPDTDEVRTELLRRRKLEDVWPTACADQGAARPLLRAAFGDACFSSRHADHAVHEEGLFDHRPALAGIAARTLVLAGAHDTLPLAKSVEIQQGIPGAEMHVFAASGHFAPLEQPDEFVRIVRAFLRP